jgi:uncharacterized protein
VFSKNRHRIRVADDGPARIGDTVVVFFDASGTARDGKPYANTYAWFLDLRDGKIVKAFAFFDSVVFNDFWTRVKS